MLENEKIWILQNILSNVEEHNSAKLLRESLFKIIDGFTPLITASGAGIYTGSITPSSEVPTEVGDKVFLVTQPGTYTNFGNVVLPENNFGFIYKNGANFTIQSVELPKAIVSGKVEALNTEAVSGGEVYSSISNFSKKSKNLVNYKKFKGSSFSVSATTNKIVETPNVNWLSVIVEDGVLENQTFYLDGAGVFTSSQTAVVFFTDINNVHLSTIIKADFNGLFTTPTNCKKIYIHIANTANIGLNPTNNIYVNLTQLILSDKPTLFESYGIILKAPIGKVEDKNSQSVSGGEVYNTITNFASKSQNLLNWQDIVGGNFVVNTSNKVVFQPRDNWIYIKMKRPTLSNLKCFYSGFKPETGSVILFSDSADNFLAEIPQTGFDGKFDWLESYAYGYFKIANVTDIGKNPTNNIYVNSVQITEGSTSKPFAKYGVFSINESRIISEYSPFFVELFPVIETYTNVLFSKDIGYVYERLQNNIYARHTLIYQRLDYADFVSGNFSGGEVVRYAGTKLYAYDLTTKTFTYLNKEIVIGLESEFVASIDNWIGGDHGNENLSRVNFIINNKVYNVNSGVNFTPLALTPCTSFSYSMLSKMKLHADKTDVYNRIKHVEFKNGGYKITTKLEALQSKKTMMYTGICCVGKYLHQLTSDATDVINPTGSNNFFINTNLPLNPDATNPIEKRRDYFPRKIMYSSSDFQFTATSYTSKFDEKGFVLIWDRSTDTKYYRRIDDYTPNIGDTIEIVSEYILKSK